MVVGRGRCGCWPRLLPRRVGWMVLDLGLSLNPSTSPLIEPCYPRRDPLLVKPNPPQTKLLVDKRKKTFKVLVLLYKLGWTAIYDSTISSWRVHDHRPRYNMIELFGWENGFSAYNPKLVIRMDLEYHKERLATVFDANFEGWIDVEAEVPSEVAFPTDHFLLGNNKQLLLVLFSYRKRRWPYFSVWKLLDKGEDLITAGHSACSWWEKWDKVCIESKEAVKYLADHHLARACCGGKYILFVFAGNKIGEDGTLSHKCVRYSFRTSSWSVVPCPVGGSWGENFKIYNWEPCLDVDPSFRM